MSREAKHIRKLLGLAVLTLTLATTAVALTAYLVARDVANTTDVQGHKRLLECTILIIGSGFAGSYAAYRLAPIYKEKLCLVEKLDRDGGRIYDVSEFPGGPVFGAGALRVTGGQTLMHRLAWELGIKLQTVEEETELLKVRGQPFYRGNSANESESANRMCRELFPTVNCSSDPQTATHDVIFGVLSKLRAETPRVLDRHPDFPTLMLGLFGDEGLAYFKENAYHSLLSSVAISSVLEFIETEGSNFGKLSYPEGGMSQYITKMLKHATRSGMRIFRREPVRSISTEPNGSFQTETNTLLVKSKRVLCSIDPLGFTNVTGNVAEKVKSAPEFRAIAPKASVTVAAWWDERWWERSVLHGSHNLTRVTSHGNCFNEMEIATYPYGRQQNATRVVYDDGACLDTWRQLISRSGGSEKLTDEVRRSLQQVFHDVVVPRPRTINGESTRSRDAEVAENGGLTVLVKPPLSAMPGVHRVWSVNIEF